MVCNPNGKVYGLHSWSNGILIEINFIEMVKVLFGCMKILFKLFWLDLNSKFKYYLIKFLNLVQDYFT
jgi:hypothetical protein